MFLQPRITSVLGIHDTCGIHNLHGMPAILSAIASAIFAALVTRENYKSELSQIFPAMATAPENSNSTIILGVSKCVYIYFEKRQKQQNSVTLKHCTLILFTDQFFTA